MTDRPRPYHRAEAERLLDYADEWAAQAGEPMPEAGELSCLAYAAVHALLAIHDTLTGPRPGCRCHGGDSVCIVCARHDAYAAREAELRDAAEPDPLDSSRDYDEHERAAEPDPLDEDDHRDRMDGNGDIWQRVHEGCWMEPGLPPVFHGPAQCLPLTALPGTLTFAPDAAQDATGGDLSAPEGESGDMEGPDTDNAQNAILCPECDDHINEHTVSGCWYTLCDCPRTPEDVARATITDGGRDG